jgi:site-specific DNA recombinase
MPIPAIGDTDGSAPGIRVAFYGRTASEADAYPAIQRQLEVAKDALPSNARIVRSYVDVASRSGLNGSVVDTFEWHLDGYPVSGGILALLRTASQAPRNFDAVVCASLDRLARQPLEYLHIMDELAVHHINIITIADDCPRYPR